MDDETVQVIKKFQELEKNLENIKNLYNITKSIDTSGVNIKDLDQKQLQIDEIQGKFSEYHENLSNLDSNKLEVWDLLNNFTIFETLGTLILLLFFYFMIRKIFFNDK